MSAHDSNLRFMAGSDRLPNDPDTNIELYETLDEGDQKQFIVWTVKHLEGGGRQRFYGHYFPVFNYDGKKTPAMLDAMRRFDQKCKESGVAGVYGV